MGDNMEKIKNNIILNVCYDIIVILFGGISPLLIINQSLYGVKGFAPVHLMVINIFSPQIISDASYLKQAVVYVVSGLMLGVMVMGIAFLQNDIEKIKKERNEII